jgi:hypothetical protein
LFPDVLAETRTVRSTRMRAAPFPLSPATARPTLTASPSLTTAARRNSSSLQTATSGSPRLRPTTPTLSAVLCGSLQKPSWWMYRDECGVTCRSAPGDVSWLAWPPHLSMRPTTTAKHQFTSAARDERSLDGLLPAGSPEVVERCPASCRRPRSSVQATSSPWAIAAAE